MTTETSQTPISEHLSHPKYRPDIDGLRAIAVLSVVIYHAFPKFIRGGFIGVDIFFVISGFLISTIIMGNLERNSFSFIEFYSRRIKRIFPALLLVLIASLVFGWFALLADEYKQLGKHIAGGTGFISNFLFWNESGYFDNAAEAKPLLHLWSLGIEEQFYIVWPLLLWLAWTKRFNLLVITISVAVTSFALNISKIHGDVVATFYSPQTRFWELLLGSILAYMTLHRLSIFPKFKHTLDMWLGNTFDTQTPRKNGNAIHNAESFLGAFLILTGLFVITKDSFFPGWWALLPTIGALLIISSGMQAWFNRVVLSSRVLVWFGLISFPLYLWHWPLLSFARIVEGEVPSSNIRIAVILLSITLAWLTYRFVERPVRLGKHGNLTICLLVVLMSSIGYVGYNIYSRGGLSFRNVAKISSGFDGGASITLDQSCGIVDTTLVKQLAFCEKDSRGPSKYALVGDSKAASIFGGLVRTSSESGRWLFIGGNGPYGAPIPVISDNAIYKRSMPLSIAAINAIAQNKQVKVVVYVTATRVLFNLSNDTDIEDLGASKNYDAALIGLKSSIQILKKAGKKVVLVVDNPTLPHPEDCLNRITKIPLLNKSQIRYNPKCVIPISRHLFLSKRYRQLFEEVKATYPDDVSIFDTTKLLCDQNLGVCSHHSEDGRPLYSYGDHISDFAAGLIGKELNIFLTSL